MCERWSQGEERHKSLHTKSQEIMSTTEKSQHNNILMLLRDKNVNPTELDKRK